jgi:hypothetical protein
VAAVGAAVGGGGVYVTGGGVDAVVGAVVGVVAFLLTHAPSAVHVSSAPHGGLHADTHAPFAQTNPGRQGG